MVFIHGPTSDAIYANNRMIFSKGIKYLTLIGYRLLGKPPIQIL